MDADKNDLTIQTYRDNFDKYIERTPAQIGDEFKKWLDAFLAQLPATGEIFEFGSAFGRDARYMKERGYQVFCTDIIPQALEQLSKDSFNTAEYDFRNKPENEWKGRFDGVFANAVLLHAPQEVFEQALWNILEILKSKGVCAFSLKSGSGEEISVEKMDAPRFFKYYSPEELKSTLAAYPIEIISLNTADAGKWLHAIFRKKQ